MKHTNSINCRELVRSYNKFNINIKINLYKFFSKDYNQYNEIIFMRNERFWRKKTIKERKNTKQ